MSNHGIEQLKNELKQLRELLYTHQRRLHQLKRRKAFMGIDVPPQISMQIEDIEKEKHDIEIEITEKERLIDQLSQEDLKKLSQTIKIIQKRSNGVNQRINKLSLTLPEGSIRFANRAYELDIILRPFGPKFTLIDAPAGYGKSYFLQEINKKLSSIEGQNCTIINLQENEALCEDKIGIIRALAFQICGEKIDDRNLTDSISLLAGCIASPQRNIKNVMLIFDSLELLNTEMASWLRDQLISDLNTRLSARNIMLRTIFAGRYIGQNWSRGKLFLYELPLSPFDEEIIEEVIQTAAKDLTGALLNPSVAADIAKSVFDVSGGHPKNITNILYEIAEVYFAINLETHFIGENRKRLFDNYVNKTLEDILKGVNLKLRDALKCISVFRCFNTDSLDILIKEGKIHGFRSGFDLLAHLRNTRLISTPSTALPMYADKMIRRMLLVQIRLENETFYQEMNELAQRIYEAWIRSEDIYGTKLPNKVTDNLQVVFIIESLYHYLQSEGIVRDRTKLKQMLVKKFNDYFKILDSAIGGVIDVAFQLKDAFQKDIEISHKVRELIGDEGYKQILDLIDDFIK